MWCLQNIKADQGGYVQSPERVRVFPFVPKDELQRRCGALCIGAAQRPVDFHLEVVDNTVMLRKARVIGEDPNVVPDVQTVQRMLQVSSP